MADLNPEDIHDLQEPPPSSWLKTPEEPPPPADEPLPPDDEEQDADEEKGKLDLAAAVEHLTIAVAELARASGSPRGVVGALDHARIALGK